MKRPARRAIPVAVKRAGCKLDGCIREVFARGMCGSHYKRWWKYGDPLEGSTNTGAPQAFIDAALSSKTDECILWPFAQGHKGYAQISRGGKRLIVSRLVCIEAHGEPPSDEHHAAHSCGNGHRGCINPRHLRWATIIENEADKEKHGTLLYGDNAPWAILSEAKAIEIFNRAHSGENQRKLADEFGVCQQVISNIKHRKSWKRATESQHASP